MLFSAIAIITGFGTGLADSAFKTGDGYTPAQIEKRFDSLLDAGAEKEARALCTGTALRMFPFLVESEKKLAPLIDSAHSRDTVVEQRQDGKWCGLKMVSDVAFRKPMLGMNSMHAVQVVHLFRKPEGWRLAEFEELANESAPWALRQGTPTESATPRDLFPTSHLAPNSGSDITRMRLQITLSGGGVPPNFPEGPGQKVLRRGREKLEVETSRPNLPATSPWNSRTASLSANLAPELASGPYLDLRDTLLLAKAAELRQGAGNEVEYARRVYDFVQSAFHFELGAVLFGTSSEVMRSFRGDCSEAAVLTAALLRAGGVPSRVDLGFATLGRGVFVGHAWAEAFVGGSWIGVDAALREFPAGAQRLSLLRLNGNEDMRVEASNLMLRVLANLDIQITGAWSANRALRLRVQPGNADEGRAFFEKVLQGMGK